MIVAYNKEYNIFLTDEDYKPKEYPERQKHNGKRKENYRIYYLMKKQKPKLIHSLIFEEKVKVV